MKNLENLRITFSEEGNKYASELGFNSEGDVVAVKYSCAKDNCNCCGSWISGNEEEVAEWL